MTIDELVNGCASVELALVHLDEESNKLQKYCTDSKKSFDKQINQIKKESKNANGQIDDLKELLQRANDEFEERFSAEQALYDSINVALNQLKKNIPNYDKAIIELSQQISDIKAELKVNKPQPEKVKQTSNNLVEIDSLVDDIPEDFIPFPIPNRVSIKPYANNKGVKAWLDTDIYQGREKIRIHFTKSPAEKVRVKMKADGWWYYGLGVCWTKDDTDENRKEAIRIIKQLK